MDHVSILAYFRCRLWGSSTISKPKNYRLRREYEILIHSLIANCISAFVSDDQDLQTFVTGATEKQQRKRNVGASSSPCVPDVIAVKQSSSKLSVISLDLVNRPSTMPFRTSQVLCVQDQVSSYASRYLGPSSKYELLLCKCGLPSVIGAIDCTHIRVIPPADEEFGYVNRKSFHSLNVQLISDQVDESQCGGEAYWFIARYYVLRDSAIVVAMEEGKWKECFLGLWIHNRMVLAISSVR
uniref:DDE Tnp4 domain-containing protein n=1 Tax=Ditylenchus dipsaci TaxID=166011 RepID=A0A915D5B0_9BILA